MTDPAPQPLRLVRNPRARRYILRLAPDGTPRVTIPRGGSESFARAFAARHALWIQRQQERWARRPTPPPPTPWGPGTLVWFRGAPHPLEATPLGARLHDLEIPLRPPPSPDSDWRLSIEAALRRLAEREFPPLVHAYAQRLGLPLRRVTIRAQRSRWGSCSPRRTLSLNWRLIQTPDTVRDYVFAHELAHLREMNHSRRFWRVVQEFYPAWREAEAWLQRHGRLLLQSPPPPPSP